MNKIKMLYVSLSSIMCEPTTVITDIVLSLFSFWCCYFIFANFKEKGYRHNWALFFLFVGCSTLFGGAAHTVSCGSKGLAYQAFWLIMQIFSGLSLYFAQNATFHSEFQKTGTRRLLQQAALVQLLCFIVCVIIFMDFKVVAINSALGAAQLLLMLFPKNKERLTYKLLIISGLITTFLSIYINQKQLSLSSWFTHKDVAHVFMLLSLFLMFRGVINNKQEQTVLSA